MKAFQRCWIVGVLLLSASAAWAQPATTEYKPPEDVSFRKATIISEGTRMAAELFTLKDNKAKALPTIIMSHGWGGVAASLRTNAVDFARAGYFVVVFDYRGWGESEGRIVTTKPLVRGKPGEPGLPSGAGRRSADPGRRRRNHPDRGGRQRQRVPARLLEPLLLPAGPAWRHARDPAG